jgi:hypothetical protein
MENTPIALRALVPLVGWPLPGPGLQPTGAADTAALRISSLSRSATWCSCNHPKKEDMWWYVDTSRQNMVKQLVNGSLNGWWFAVSRFFVSLSLWLSFPSRLLLFELKCLVYGIRGWWWVKTDHNRAETMIWGGTSILMLWCYPGFDSYTYGKLKTDATMPAD